jgi:hypothetical protein
MLAAIGRVESGRVDPGTGHIHPWPWTINAEGHGNFFATKAQAVAFAEQLRARGVQSFDAGCLQVNLMHHPDAFRSLEEAFDPVANARYAVKFLTQLRDKVGSWEIASAWYHSANPLYGEPYREQVVTAMDQEAKTSTSYVASLVAPLLIAPSLPGMFANHGNVIMLPRPSGSTVLASSNATVAAASSQSATAVAPGRGLDSYRAQPVRFMQTRLTLR